ncbi:MAG: carboxypeptidase [Shinella sp.]|nr:carboxypeptidase [Shinella sp.]
MTFRTIALSLLVLLPIAALPATAQERAHQAGTSEENAGRPQTPEAPAGILGLLPADSVTDHVLKTENGELPYTATAGTLTLYGQNGAPSAKIFYTAYKAKDGPRDRPLTFAFNGGPGAASAYLHMGLVGPRILDFGANGHDGTAPVLTDNPESWLAFTDLVMIDPVGTGWSRAASNDAASSFYGVRQDADSIAKAITLYVNQNQRLSSPKYLLGESYGGFRAMKVASALKDDQGILVSGVIMVSPLVEGQLIFGANGFALGAALQFPSLAAAELERRSAFSIEALQNAERFAMTDYLVALAGPPLWGEKAASFYARVSELTGIPRDVVERTRGFVSDVYAKNAAKDKSQVVSPYDASFAVPDPYPEAGYDRSDDPVLDGFTRAYGAAFASYARDELGFRTEMTYSLLSGDVNRRWDWGGSPRAQASVTDDIRDMLSTVPSFRLMITHGYSDALTPYGVSKYVVEHLPPELAGKRVDLKVYRGGHMFYTRADARRDMSADARIFIEGRATD